MKGNKLVNPARKCTILKF